ncbi:DUF1800 domain-containing protein [Cellvibrio fibrivorans]|uniref:Uncharacterized protein (DUF1800 family) n=1 Tax=Cellvibrio fibrivorans TaxID=126350 RepID=A0ABU1V3C5_9GAMM|nr:DUF1800 domain-containing protein [Cellvibrio fibrivorans]MDR7091895.1 uncharacterized protein (DUF1800 family) [Cellvibrio fibrivorans]
MKKRSEVVMLGLLRTVVISASVLMIACGGGGGGGGTMNPTGSSAVAIASSTSASSLAPASSLASIASSRSSIASSAAIAKIPTPDLTPDPALPIKDSPNYTSAKEAARFLAQTTFGPTAKDIDRIVRIGKTAWLDEQFSKPQTKHLLLLDQRFEQIGFVVQPEQDDSDEGYLRDLQRSDIWWEVALWGEDQLRQRIAYSLSQILVISNVSDVLYNDTRGIANYQDILAQHAFGNYRDLLKAVTLNPMMGEYLSMVRNEKADSNRNIRPDENYARELMQLFTIGLVHLNLDGSVKLDAQGNPIPTYDQTTVKELARVFTGWNMATIKNWWEWTESGASEILPMKSFDNYHDFNAKMLFGDKPIPADKTPEQDIDAALDIIFTHPNVAPFIGKQLIQRLVTSNPSPAYVTRVATVFNDNGQGVKGDMKAVVRAIILDDEAQNGYKNSPSTFGKLREPLLKTTHLWRAFKGTGTPTKLENNTVTPPRLRFYGSGRLMGQRPYGSFSVFNFYRPEYQHPGELKNANMNSPEFQILTESMIMSKASTLSSAIFWRDTPHDWLEPTIDGNWDVFSPRLHLDRERELSKNPAELLDHLNLILMAGQMSEQMYELILNHLNANKVDPTWDETGQMWARDMLVYEAMFLVVASPEYAAQR